MVRLEQEFERRYGARPQMVRAPGRVNLIGEHTDYNGLPVFPMAIGREIRLAFAPREDDWIELQNCDPAFPARRFQADHNITPYEKGDWGNYVKAAVLDIIKRENLARPVGMNVLVSGTIPVASGLSSSTALVVASALAFLTCNGLTWNPAALAEHLARAEKFVGTEGGGMDQAVILLAKEGHALRIDFFPLRTLSVKLPENVEVLICKSMIVAPKTASARMMYNQRSMECRLVHAMLRKALGQRWGERISSERLGDLVSLWLEREGAVAELIAFGKEIFGERNCSLQEIAAFLDETPASIREKYLQLTDGSLFPEPEGGFVLFPRLRHVVSEGERVWQATSVAGRDPETFGRLMDESHLSCRNDYQISCPELDELVRLARQGGALGARLTGAGFGGCTVSLVPKSAVDRCVETIWEGYYQGYLKAKHPQLYEKLGDIDECCFFCRPEAGAGLVGEQ